MEKISVSLAKFFDRQRDYIFCKEGCAICCETGQYPFSEVEFQYAMIGFSALPENQKEMIKEKIKNIKKDQSWSYDDKFMYECPFLLDKKCSIYLHRGIICRTYGLMYYTEDETGKTVYRMPCCTKNELNYSNVYDEATGKISDTKWRESGIKEEPVSFNIGRKFLMNNQRVKDLELEFGEQKALIDWF